VTTGIDQSRATEQEPDQPTAAQAAALPALTPEEALRLAAILAPHLVAMRAVTAGTRYEYTADGGDALMSPAVKIFIAGTLHRPTA
jgi:hypothetical protein